MESPFKQAIQLCAALGIKPANQVLFVKISAQTLQLHRDGALAKAWPVSTSRRPPSNLKGSLGTPRGLHAIAEKIGHGQPPGVVFKSRVPTGRHFHEFETAADENLITTRILWLRGLEPGVNAGGNVDSHARYIYIHGTNHEERIGRPQSAGCILLRGLDLIELFELVRTSDLVLITD